MDEKDIVRILNAVAKGRLGAGEALQKLKPLTFENISCARIDHHREMRQGVPEVLFASGKTTAHVVRIGRAMHKRSGRLLVTRATREIHRGLRIRGAVFHTQSGMITAGGAPGGGGRVLVLSAGTSDIPVAEEAAVTAEFLGCEVRTVYDVGVAGLHRILESAEDLRTAHAIVVVAGMEGALPSVVGSMTQRPLIAVPTSVGYGTSLGGLTALFAMLNSCVPGIAVMNIDNGFGAGCLAHRIAAAGAGRQRPETKGRKIRK